MASVWHAYGTVRLGRAALTRSVALCGAIAREHGPHDPQATPREDRAEKPPHGGAAAEAPPPRPLRGADSLRGRACHPRRLGDAGRGRGRHRAEGEDHDPARRERGEVLPRDGRGIPGADEPGSADLRPDADRPGAVVRGRARGGAQADADRGGVARPRRAEIRRGGVGRAGAISGRLRPARGRGRGRRDAAEGVFPSGMALRSGSCADESLRADMDPEPEGQTMTRHLAAAATGLSLALAPVALVPAFAQTAGTETETAITDETLTAFVMAALDVAEVNQSYQAELQAAPDEAAQQAVVQEAQAAMVAAVEETDGITVDEYISISQAAAADADLDARIQTKLQEVLPAE